MLVAFLIRWVLLHFKNQIIRTYTLETEIITAASLGIDAYSNVYLVETLYVLLVGVLRALKV